jgi:signal transduction histidine kinase/CheY-like chemotaxis protein
MERGSISLATARHWAGRWSIPIGATVTAACVIAGAVTGHWQLWAVAALFLAFLISAVVMSAISESLAEAEASRAHAEASAAQIRLVADVALALTHGETLEQTLQECADAIVRHVGVAFARIWVVDDKEQVLRLKASAGMYRHIDGPHSTIKLGGKLKISQIALDDRPRLSNQLHRETWVSNPEWVEREKMVAFAGYPLTIGGRVVGVVAMFSRQALPATVMVSLSSVAESMALGIARRRAEEERKLLLERIQESDRRKDEFLAMLGHELRNPLAPVTTAIELMKRKGAGPLEHERSLIERQVQHLSRLVDDLLDMSRITHGRIQLRKERVRLASVVGKAIEISAPLIRGRGHDLSVNVPTELYVDGDPVRLAQVYANLLTNAAKYTPVGGSLQVEAFAEGAQVVVAIVDNGVGFQAEELESLFEPFISHSSEGSEPGGLGIGLALVKKLVELHGGTVHAESAGPSQGSRFEVRLPLAPATDSPVPPEELPRVQHIAPQRVLVVDDNVDAAETLAEALRVDGHEVQVAFDAKHALEVSAAFQPTVAVLDIGMPGMDGLALARRFRARWPREQLRLIALTGYGQENDRLETREAGFDAHLVKPIELAEIHAAVERNSADAWTLDDPAS